MMKDNLKCYYRYQALCEWQSVDFEETISTMQLIAVFIFFQPTH